MQGLTLSLSHLAGQGLEHAKENERNSEFSTTWTQRAARSGAAVTGIVGVAEAIIAIVATIITYGSYKLGATSDYYNKKCVEWIQNACRGISNAWEVAVNNNGNNLKSHVSATTYERVRRLPGGSWE